MSWWAYLRAPDEAEAVEVVRHEDGGTYALGGIERAELNVTYNYGAHFRDAIPEAEGSGILVLLLDGKTGAETVPVLRRIVDHCGTERDKDYWEPTPGNAGYAAALMLAWAELHPEAVWDVH